MIVDVGVGENPRGDINIDLVRTPYCNLVAHAEFLPLKENTVGLFLCSQVLEHLDNPIRAFKEANRVLKDDGKGNINFPKPYFANHARTRLFLFFLNFPFSMLPSSLKTMRRALKGIRKKDPRWYHKHVIKISDVRQYFEVKEIVEIGDVFVSFLNHGRKAKYFKNKPRLCVSYRLIVKKLLNQ